MNTVVIAEELIRYSAVSARAPWQLLDCERGAWGTRAAAHVGGQAVGRLLDHDYKVFLGDADLSREIARNVASLFNDSGSLQLSFDGLEGNWSTGQGQYGCALFTKAWYDALAPELRGRVINDASGPGHFSWHIYTRMNWGEPWYAGFRESQTLYRFKNQFYFERNLMPPSSAGSPSARRPASRTPNGCVRARRDSMRASPWPPVWQAQRSSRPIRPPLASPLRLRLLRATFDRGAYHLVTLPLPPSTPPHPPMRGPAPSGHRKT